MKRFMLVSLMSCMLVGQVSCYWHWRAYGLAARDYAMGALESLSVSSKFAVLGGSLGSSMGAFMAARDAQTKQEVTEGAKIGSALGLIGGFALASSLYSCDVLANFLKRRSFNSYERGLATPGLSFLAIGALYAIRKYRSLPDTVNDA